MLINRHAGDKLNNTYRMIGTASHLQVRSRAPVEAAQIPVTPEGGRVDAIPRACAAVSHPIGRVVELDEVQPRVQMLVHFVWEIECSESQHLLL